MNEYESMNVSEREKRERETGEEKLNGAAESMRRKVRRSVHDLVMMIIIILTTHHHHQFVDSHSQSDTYIVD